MLQALEELVRYIYFFKTQVASRFLVKAKMILDIPGNSHLGQGISAKQNIHPAWLS